jgi:DNA-binding FadR family transcriptional regulator
MSEGQSQRSVASSAQHRQEVEVAAAETAATATKAARLAELAAARAEVEAAAAAAELEVLRGSSISSSVSANGGTDDELKLVREAARAGGAVGSRAPTGTRWRHPRRARPCRRPCHR